MFKPIGLCLLVTILSSMIGVSQAFAQNGTQWNSSLSFAGSTNLYDFQDGTRQDGLNYGLSTGLRFNRFWSLSTSISYQQSVQYPEYNDVSDIPVSLSYSGYEYPNFADLGMSTTAILPVSKQSTKGSSLLLSTHFGLSLKLKPENTGNWILGANLSVGKNFHQYETALSGQVLNQYVSKQGINATYVLGKVYLSAEFVHRNAISYAGTLKESFSHTESISYGITSAISISAGHTNEGSIYKANGIDNNINLINENASMVWAALEMAI